jgi:hypothetical protein
MILVAMLRLPCGGYTAVVIALRSAPDDAARWTADPARVPPRPARISTITNPE